MVGSVPVSTIPQSRPAASRPKRRPFFVICLFLLRILAVAHAAFAIAQPITMGQYLVGSYQMLAQHSLFGHLLSVAVLLMAVVALLYAIAGGRIWIVIATWPLFLIEGFQIGMGYVRSLGVHVPLGVGLVTVAILLAIATFLPGASRDRGSKASRTAAGS